MSGKSLILSFFVFLFLSVSVFAQGDYLEKGKSGTQLGLQYVNNDAASGIFLGGGTSSRGIIDGQFYIGYNHSTKSSVNALALVPSIFIYPLKQGMANIPFSIGFGGSFNIMYFLSENKGITEVSYSLGVWLLRNLNINESITFQPNVGVSRVYQEEGWQGDCFNLGLSMFFKFINKHKALRLDFTYSNSEQIKIKSYGIQLGLIFESYKKEVDE